MSAADQPSPSARRRGDVPPGDPSRLRRATARSTATAIFAKTLRSFGVDDAGEYSGTKRQRGGGRPRGGPTHVRSHFVEGEIAGGEPEVLRAGAGTAGIQGPR